MMTLILISFLVSKTASACDVTAKKIVFRGMGTHLAYYCKATDAEKLAAIGATKNHACIPEKLAALGKPILSTEATDLVPYWFTKSDAERAGPVLEIRLTLARTAENGERKVMGYRAVATGRKAATPPAPAPTPAPAFELGIPSIFERRCGPYAQLQSDETRDECVDRFSDLCPTPERAN